MNQSYYLCKLNHEHFMRVFVPLVGAAVSLIKKIIVKFVSLDGDMVFLSIYLQVCIILKINKLKKNSRS